MKKIFVAVVLAATAAGLGAATAMPLAPLDASDTASIIKVAQGCGPGFARGRYGECRPMFRRPPPPPPRFCPPGFFSTPHGRCVRRW